MPAVIDNLYTTLTLIKAFKSHRTITGCISGSMTTENIMHNIASVFSVISEYILHTSKDSV